MMTCSSSFLHSWGKCSLPDGDAAAHANAVPDVPDLETGNGCGPAQGEICSWDPLGSRICELLVNSVNLNIEW